MVTFRGLVAIWPEADIDFVGLLARFRGMDELWGPLVAQDWRSTPATAGRTATEIDVKAGRAVFYIRGGSVPHQIAIPICAIHRDVETGRATPVVVIQAEEAGDQTVLGVRLLEGGNMVCTLAEVEFLAEPDPRFFPA